MCQSRFDYRLSITNVLNEEEVRREWEAQEEIKDINEYINKEYEYVYNTSIKFLGWARK